MTSQDWFSKDFYAALGVSKDASADEIKKAYRKLARDLHPDRHLGDTTSEERFKEVGEAYGVLSDPKQRQQYDAVRAMGGGGPRFQAGGPGGAGFEDVFSGMFGGGAGGPGAPGAGGPQYRAQGFEDMLGNLFGGGFQRGPVKGTDIAAATEVSFRQATEGATITLRTATGDITTRLPVGVRDGQKIRLRGKGRPSANGGPAGDLLLTVRVAKHPVFSADGRNLHITVPVTYDEAVLGATVEVPTLDGGRVKVKIPAGTPSGKTLRIKGRGLQAKDGAGDLLVTVEVAVPSRLSRKAKEVLQAFALETAKDEPRKDLYRDAAK
ncbi:DnaJ C-terminal domain-containing protein [Demequina muriae]|uniref:DnaJ C-terminal domain-containing protein n=1 Tax=Demequina muriae TaxID=3051664 RepID=A0ABT8GH12_9MICO|nr:DnaJ C-terminal domain-containing protein [Demequina sp. EGI L300058]MDN4480720.1 DnaJ C-terminal domain-containing protein [Demequina sp. EGI L300058]